jgi:hypothetical protein
LQADWQEVWHSPLPPCLIECFRSIVFSEMMRFNAFTFFDNRVGMTGSGRFVPSEKNYNEKSRLFL